MGQTEYNLNGLKTATRVDGHRLVLGELPGKLRRQTSYARRYRRMLETAVIDARGVVSLTDSHYVDLAAASEAHRCVCNWLLRERIDTMPTSDVLACSREMVRARETRNKAVKELQLDVEPEPIDLSTYLVEKSNNEG